MGETGEDHSRPPVVIVTGPTASGKTAIGIQLARRFDGEILNADSMQVYRHLDIGTAKPTLAERAKVSHHLIDHGVARAACADLQLPLHDPQSVSFGEKHVDRPTTGFSH